MKIQNNEKPKEEKHSSKDAKNNISTAWVYRRENGSNNKLNEIYKPKDILIKKDFLEYRDEDELNIDTRTKSTNSLLKNQFIENEINSSIDVLSDLSIQTQQTYQESRIVAPNVSKLSPQSVVEIRLESEKEKVAVLCAVDVLKMRSGFFHDVLMEQERKVNHTTTIHSNNPSKQNNNTINTNNNHNTNINNILWREPIIVPEISPYEAAAYLESLHEGRALFQGEWNFCWARLSVAWVIEDLIIEYASQIVKHMNKLTALIKQHHWRLNPNVLAGMRVAVFRKGSNPLPTIVTGVAIDVVSNNSLGYSKLRIAFDQDKVITNHNLSPISCNSSIHDNSINSSTLESRINKISNSNSSSIYYNNIIKDFNGSINMKQNLNYHHNPKSIHKIDNSPIQITPTLTNQGNIQYLDTLHTTATINNHMNNNNNNHMNNTNTTNNIGNMVGDVTEPLWVQFMKENSIWCDPDELFLTEAKKFISYIDKCMFWEMARSLIEFPEYTIACQESAICTIEDLKNALKRPENRILWINEGAECLPKQVVSELIRVAYVSTL